MFLNIFNYSKNIIYNLRQIIAKILLILGIGAIFVAISEFWFYKLPNDSWYIEVLLAYWVIWYAFLILLSHYQVRNFKWFYLVAAIFGFLIEWVPVPALFIALPFTIVWTSLAWHALISVSLFFFYFRIFMNRSIWWKKIFLMIILWISLWAWNSYMWNIVELSNWNEIIQKFIPNWFLTSVFAEQFISWFLLFLFWHIIFQFSYTKSLPFIKWEKWVLIIFIWIIYVFVSLLNLFPFSLAIFPLLYICHLALNNHKKVRNNMMEKSKIIFEDFWKFKLSIFDYFYTFLIPISAILTYDFLLVNSVEIEMNVFLIFTAWPISVYLFLKSLLFTNK